MRDRTSLEVPSHGRTRRQAVVSIATAFGCLALGSIKVRAEAEDEIRSAESIHQEPFFKASRKRVYEALTDAKQFDKVIQLSAAKMSMGGKPTEIVSKEGGTFAIFGGYITGRQIELVPNQRIVQVWRVGSWDPGAYSIAKFELKEQGSGTKIIFDHTGFPKGLGQHLAAGWKANYWEPLEKFLT